MQTEPPTQIPAQYLQTFIDKRCGVCYKPHIIGKQDPSTHSSYTLTTIEPILEFAICKKCGLTVHEQCYGIVGKCQENVNMVREFVCDRCLIGGRGKCWVCKQGGDALKRIGDGKLIHISCGINNRKWFVCTSFKEMKFQFQQQQQQQKTTGNINQCKVCKQSNGGIYKCEMNCKWEGHLNCLYKVREDQDIGYAGFWIKKNKEKGLLAIESIIEEYKVTDCEEFCRIVAKIEENNSSSSNKEQLQENGGKVQIICPKHYDQKMQESQCICGKGDNGDNSQWVQCDYCDMWIHEKCFQKEKLLPQENLNNKIMYCHLCQKWRNVREDFLKNNDFQVLVEYLTQDLINKFSLFDMILICQFIEKSMGDNMISNERIDEFPKINQQIRRLFSFIPMNMNYLYQQLISEQLLVCINFWWNNIFKYSFLCYEINNPENNLFEITLNYTKYIELNKAKNCFIELVKQLPDLEIKQIQNYFTRNIKIAQFSIEVYNLLEKFMNQSDSNKKVIAKSFNFNLPENNLNFKKINAEKYNELKTQFINNNNKDEYNTDTDFPSLYFLNNQVEQILSVKNELVDLYSRLQKEQESKIKINTQFFISLVNQKISLERVKQLKEITAKNFFILDGLIEWLDSMVSRYEKWLEQ